MANFWGKTRILTSRLSRALFCVVLLFAVFFSSNSYAADGYSCSITYTRCAADRYLNGGLCDPCPNNSRGNPDNDNLHTYQSCTCETGYTTDGMPTGANNTTTTTTDCQAIVSAVTITLSFGSGVTNSPTQYIYARPGDGCYLDSAATGQKMSTSANAVTTPTKAGYTFDGYNLVDTQTQIIGANGKLTNDGDTWCPNVMTGSAPILTARWIQQTYTVTYDLNCPSGTDCGAAPSPQLCNVGEACTLSASGNTNTFYRAGYVFQGWSTSKTGTVTPSITYNTTTNRTVYAIWAACNTGYYKGADQNAAATCTQCPSGYPFTENTGSTSITQCYSGQKTRSGDPANQDLPDLTGCYSAVYSDCTPASCDYVAYSDSAGTGDGAIKSGCATNTNRCTKGVQSVVANAGYYAESGATSCTACATTNLLFPNSDQGTTNSAYCYRDCVSGDIANASAVTGRVVANGTRTCTATACNATYYLKNDTCETCPSNANCAGGTAGFVCEGGYHTNNAGDGCDGNTYTVTLDTNCPAGATCTDGQASVTVTYGSAMPTISNNSLASSTTQNLVGYFDDATGGTQYYRINNSGNAVSTRAWNKTTGATLYAHWSQVAVNCEAGKYYTGSEMADCRDGQFCPGSGTTNAGSEGCYIECSDTTLGAGYGYNNSDGTRTSVNDCYKSCDARCYDPGDCYRESVYDPAGSCPDHFLACGFDENATVPGLRHYGESETTCSRIGDNDINICPISGGIQCEAYYYINTSNNNTVCSPCVELGNHKYRYSYGYGDQTSCYYACDYDCTDDTPTYIAENSPAQCASMSVFGGAFYPSDVCQPDYMKGASCAPTTCSCPEGYTLVLPDIWSLQDGAKVSCTPNTYTITLYDDKNDTSVAIYQKYATGWYKNYDSGTGTVSNEISGTDLAITPPTFGNGDEWVFSGYYTTLDTDDGEKIINMDGRLNVGNNRFTSNVTLYARWAHNLYQCTQGYTAANEECPENHYCPGGEVDHDMRFNESTGCSRTCPADAGGGTVSSPEGTNSITGCQTERTGQDLHDLNDGVHAVGSADAPSSGGGNQVCNYAEATSAYTNCKKVAIKYCYAGYYRAANDATSCQNVGRGNWSPAPTSANDPISIAVYACSTLPGYINTNNAATESETSGSPEDCYNTCLTTNVVDGSDVIIGSREPYSTTVNFVGTISDYTTTPVTTSGSYAACTYKAPVCNAGYHTVGNTCEPNVYTFTLNKNGGTSGTNTIYMKYNTGWYFDADATTPINSSNPVVLPTKDAENCSGYDMSNTPVIGDDGIVIAATTLVNNDQPETPIELTANWSAKQYVDCTIGQYFSHTANNNAGACLPCPAGSYCSGGRAFNGPDNQGVDKYRTACPTPVANTNYTPAQTFNGTTLVNVDPDVNSLAGSDEESDCFATVQYSATKGKGSQVCHYAAGRYSSDCDTIKILTCDSGYYRDGANDTDCKIAGFQYYSAEYAPTRERCPEAEYPVDDPRNTISTDNDTSELVGRCVQTGMWENTSHGGRTTRCHYNGTESAYTANCDSYTLRVCDAGYYDATDGAQSSDSDLDCVPVGNKHFSPAQSECPNEDLQPTSEQGCSTKRTACPDGTGATDTNGDAATTGINTASSITQCYLTCNATKNLNGTTVNVVNSQVHYNTNTETYNTCTYDSNVCPKDMWCDEDGFHDCPADKDGIAGKADLVEDQKYRPITTCYILYDPWPTTFSANYASTRTPWGHGTGWVKAFYKETATDGDYTNYYNMHALTCDGGYYYDSAMLCSDVTACHYSPGQDAFPGESVTRDTPGSSIRAVECPSGCSGSLANAENYTQCFKACPENVADFPHSKTVASIDEDKRVFADSDSTYVACKYHITCNTGYDVQNDMSASPSCVAHTYTVTMNKNGGMGSTAASVTCTFDSGACNLPSIVDTRDGYTTAGKWCTDVDGNGTCYDAGSTVTTNISADASDITLYAQWTPVIYTITLKHNGAGTTGTPEKVYLKYANGWYSDADANNTITELTRKPVKGVMTFTGYAGNGVTVIDSEGKFKTTPDALTFTTANTNVTAQWTDAPITCSAGTYYPGTGDGTDACLPCKENHYCAGDATTTTNSGQETGAVPCPDNGNAPSGSSVSSACYKELLPTYVATHGTGTQTCHYDENATGSNKYTADCSNAVITSCDAGYYLGETQADPTHPDCTEVGTGYYSGNTELIRHECPNGGTTDGTTKTSIHDCFKTGLDYKSDDETGTGTQSCWYTSGDGNDAIYSRECFDKTITKCRGGYYREHETDILCIEADYNYYSNEDDIYQHPCEGQGKTRRKATVQIDLCYEDGLEYVADHGGGSQTCFWNTVDSEYNISCGDKQITYCNGGYWLNEGITSIDCSEVGYAHYSPYPDLSNHECPAGQTTQTATSTSESDCFVCPENSVCAPGQGPKTCSELTSGQYTKSDAGTSDVGYCYKDCPSVEHAQTTTGRDYYDSMHDSCAIIACEPGYRLENGMCVDCPAGYYCPGDVSSGEGGAIACSTLDSDDRFTQWIYSATNATTASECYAKCLERTIRGGRAIPDKPKVYYYEHCTFTGISDTGNECDPEQLANDICVEMSCSPDYEMVNGTCQKCNREHAIEYEDVGNCIVKQCLFGYHPNADACEDDVRDCTDYIPNALNATSTWNTTLKAFDICRVQTCETDYHVASNTCVPNEQECAVPHGIGSQTWNKAMNKWNDCVAVSCDAGYTDDKYQKKNQNEQCSECKNKYSAYGDQAVSSYVNECEIASCMYQGEKYALEGGECIPICAPGYTKNNPYVDSDRTGSMYWDDIAHKCVRTCSPGYKIW